ncbi:MAG: AtpZ/AtpI family protein [Patescibacteria group bacterium]|nr:AtpZ/AtpI family protein [Patescibacteria group bacterium]
MPSSDRNNGLWVAIGFAWRLGYSIAVPLVILLLAGRLLDKKFGTSPWFLLVGLGISFVITNILMFREAFRVMRQAEQEDAPAPKSKKPDSK